jgi:hypothetical protein
MEQEDYLKKQIDQLARILGKILTDMLGLKNQGQVGAGIEMSIQALKDELDIDIQELIELETSHFIPSLQSEKGFTDVALEQLASLLLAFADNQQYGDSKKVYRKCLAIYEYLEKVDKTYSVERHLKMDRIKKLV